MGYWIFSGPLHHFIHLEICISAQFYLEIAVHSPNENLGVFFIHLRTTSNAVKPDENTHQVQINLREMFQLQTGI